MGFKVLIEPFNVCIAPDVGETILERALNDGVDYPFACQQGQCGSCKSLLLEGEVEMGRLYNPLACSDEERSRGMILACQSVPLTDCRVAVVEIGGEIVHAVRELDCEVSEVERPARDIAVVRMKIVSGGPYNFVAGQYAMVTYAGMPAREYSMANRHDQAMLEFHVRRIEGGAVSEYVHATLQPGDHVAARGPFGSAYLHDEHLGPILAVAGSTGLAPMLSIIESALAIGMRQPMHLYFGVRDEADVYCRDRLDALAAGYPNLRVTVLLSEATRQNIVNDARFRLGRLDTIIAQNFAALSGFRAYIAGPPAMCEAVTVLLGKLGLPQDRILADLFYTQAERPNEVVAP